VADQTYAANSFNGDDAVVLKTGRHGCRCHRQVGFDPGSALGQRFDYNQDHTCGARLRSPPATAEPNDPFDPALQWDGYSVDTFSGLGSHVADCARPDIVINELDSDTPGTDAAEFVEFSTRRREYTAGRPGCGVLQRRDDRSYAAFDLGGFRTSAAGYFVLGNAGVSPGLVFADGLLQNGADAVALYRANASDFPTARR